MRHLRAFVLAAVSVPPIVLVSACAAPHDNVTPRHMALIEHSLRTDGFHQFFGEPTPTTTVGCADRVLGADHRGRRVYMYVTCGAWRTPRCGDSDGPNGSFPVVATIANDSVTWQEPGDGADYGETIHHMFPRRLWTAALSTKDEPRLFTSAQADAGCAKSS